MKRVQMGVSAWGAASWFITVAALATLSAGRAYADPAEAVSRVAAQSGAPDTLLVQYARGGGGFAISRDGGGRFALVCSAAIGPDLRFDWNQAFVTGAGSILYTGSPGLWRGDADGCGFVEVPEFAHQNVAALASDPDEPARTYAVTTTGGEAQNGLYTNDGKSAAWHLLGELAKPWLQTLHVLKTDTGKRFWTTEVTSTITVDEKTSVVDEQVRYRVRFSDDHAKTWTSHEVKTLDDAGHPDPRSDFRILAVEPGAPDHLYGIIERVGGRDDLLYSAKRGEPDTWQKFGEVMVLGGFSLGAQGRVYFSDIDPPSQGVFVWSGPDSTDRTAQRRNDWNVRCLRWDERAQHLLACRYWDFGVLELETSAFKPLYDLRCAEHFAPCPDIDIQCAAQLSNSFCLGTHYPSAPLCSSYNVPDAKMFSDWAPYVCMDGQGTQRPPAAADGGDVEAGANSEPLPDAAQPDPPPAKAATPAQRRSSRGCMVATPGTSTRLGAWFCGVCGVTALVRRRRKRLAS
ncbi:MAG: hypothetical protein RL701_1260 [Pseudomonadota bacterium]